MFKNYFKIAFRNLARHKAFSIINIAGLAIGMACSIFILLWVQNELSYDRFHKNAEHIYRVVCNASDFKAAVNPAAMPGELKQKLPVVKNFVRFSHPSATIFEAGERKFEEKKVFYADATLLQVFSFRLIKGDAKTAMLRNDAVLITESMSKKYFGNGNALGKVLRRNNDNNVVVTGVLADIRSNSHLQFDCIMPMSAIAKSNRDIRENIWDNFNFYTYLQLDKNFKPTPAALANLDKQLDKIYKEHVSEDKLKVSFQLQPLTDIHLHSNYQVDLPGHGDYQYVNIFFLVALFILGIACINFMNLATARSARRAKEVGLRKVIGAGRLQLIGQFLGESLLITFIAFLFAVGVVWLLLPAFNQLAGKTLSLHFLDAKLWGTLLGIALLTGLLAGSYPALFLSGFKPVKVLKGDVRTSGSAFNFRNALVVVQFVVSVVLLAGTAVVYKQLNYIKTMNLGFEKSNLIYMPMSGEMWGKKEALKNKLRESPQTADFTIVDELPTNLHSGSTNIKWEGKDPNSQIVFPGMYVDEDFIEVFRMTLLNGRSFSREFKADTTNYMLNETAVKVMGMTAENAVGKPLSMNDNKGTIIGVVKDFNFKPIMQPIEPMILSLNTYGGIVVVRTKPGGTEAAIKDLQKISAAINPANPFSYGFLDEDIANLYQGEQRMGSLFNVFAILAIFISCLGLYGLSAFMAEQRTKEIGVRKVLGASVMNVVYLLGSGFTKLILVALLIGLPLAWLAINSWLKSFAYRVSADWLIFISASLAVILIAWLTVGYESVKAALSNPVKSLRTE